MSSTFRDMQNERDYLVKKVFPALREIAEERGIPFSWCDLCFGISSFEEENIIRLCLKNIENSSPCFVGLLGENYGSIPQNFLTLSMRAYSHDIDPHSYDVDPLEEGMAFKEQSLFACKQAVVQLYKGITFSFS